MNSEIPEVVCDVSYELVNKMRSELKIYVRNRTVAIPFICLVNYLFKYQPSSAGGTHSVPATPHRLKHLPACLIQNR